MQYKIKEIYRHAALRLLKSTEAPITDIFKEDSETAKVLKKFNVFDFFCEPFVRESRYYKFKKKYLATGNSLIRNPIDKNTVMIYGSVASMTLQEYGVFEEFCEPAEKIRL